MATIKKARSEAKLTAKLPTVNVSEDMRSEVDRISKEQDVTIGDVIRTSIEQFVARYNKASQKRADSQESELN